MAKVAKVTSIKKVATVLTILWPIACVCMLLSMHFATHSLIVFFVTLGAVPIVASWVMVFVSRRLDRRTEPPWMKRDREAAARAKKKATRSLPS